MRVLEFGGYLGLGGTEKATCRWSAGLKERGHEVSVLAMKRGPREAELRHAGIPVFTCDWSPGAVAHTLAELRPDVIHMHADGGPFPGDVVGEAMLTLPKIPLVQTNIFGRLENPREDAWTDLRMFVSWTSCVQAARRSFSKLDLNFFRRNSVAVNPLDADDGPPPAAADEFRRRHGIRPDEVVFGHLSRPDPIRWGPAPVRAFYQALRANQAVKFLLREPPPEITSALRNGPDASRFIILPVTPDPEELRLTTAAMDVVLHYSKVGESFGYGIAEPMNMGKPAIVNSTPWQGQAQIELARHGECGFVASTPAALTEAIVKLAVDHELRRKMGAAGRQHIRALADPAASIDRVESMLGAAVGRQTNPHAAADLDRARETAAYLDRHQFGHSLLEQMTLRPFYYRVRFNEFRKRFRRLAEPSASSQI